MSKPLYPTQWHPRAWQPVTPCPRQRPSAGQEGRRAPCQARARVGAQGRWERTHIHARTSAGHNKYHPFYAIIGDISAIPDANRLWLHHNANGAFCVYVDQSFCNEAYRRFRYWLYVADGDETRRLKDGNKTMIIPKVAGVGAWQPRNFYEVVWQAFGRGGCMPPVYCFVGGKWMTFGEPVIDIEKNEHDYVKALKPIEGDVPPIKRSWLPATVVCGDITRVPEELRLWGARTGAICDNVIAN